MHKPIFRTLFAAGIISLLAFSSVFTGLKPGDTAPDFKLKNTDKKMVSLADYKSAKGFIIVFTCNHCPFAKAYEDRIIALDKKYKALGYPVIAINPNDSAAYPEDAWPEMVKRAKKKKYSFPYLYDESQSVAINYGATKTPHVFLLHKENNALVVKYTGAIDDNSENAKKVKEQYLENALSELMGGKDISIKTTKAIGCGIKWKK